MAGDGPRARSLRLALSQAGTRSLAEAKARWLNFSMADRRGGVTQQGPRWWIVHTVWGLGVAPLPDPFDRSFETAVMWEGRLEDCCVWIAYSRPSGRQVAHRNILKYASETRGWVHKNTQPPIELGLGAKAGRIRAIMQGYARDVPQPPKLERVGVTPRNLAVALERRKSSLAWWACLTVALQGLARGCEVALMDGEEFELEQHMVPADVTISRSTCGTRIARLRMRKRKDLQMLRGKHAEVVLAGGAADAHFDVVELLEQWLAERKRLGIPEGRPLFCHSERPWLGFTVREVRDYVKELMGLIGLDPRLYGAHSLRIGGATAALAAGVPPSLIRLMGRWSSDIYEIYCRMSLQSAVSVGQAISAAMVSGMEETFEDEHLEVLPSEAKEFTAGWGLSDVTEEVDGDDE